MQWKHFQPWYWLGRINSFRVTPICVGEIIIIGSHNGLSPDRRQAIIWTNAGLLSIEPLRTYFSENLIKVQPFSLKKMHVKMSSAKWRPSCLGLNVLMGPCLPWGMILTNRKISNIRRTKSQNWNVSRLVLQLPLPNPMKPGVKSGWRCSWSSADRRCSNYIWVINIFIAYWGAPYIRDLTVHKQSQRWDMIGNANIC